MITVNPAFATMLRYDSPEDVLSHVTDVITQFYVDPSDRNHFEEVLQREGKIDNFEHKARCKDGSHIWVSCSSRAFFDKNGQPARFESVLADITGRKQAEADRAKLETQLIHAQKMEAIGSLAGGVAHDFNNLLAGILGRITLMQRKSHPLFTEHLNAIEEYILSATNLTDQLLGVARGGKYEPKPIDLNALVTKSAEMFGRTKKEIQIHLQMSEQTVVVEADQRQIEQVLLNLYVNAWQAMPDGGNLYLKTALVTLEETACTAYKIKPGRYGKVSVTDTGVGMNEATRRRVFDPFFTTKEKGRGTGLGLASSYGIIKNHNGMINVYSELGHGATFNFYLPASDQVAQLESVEEGIVLRGTETILLVDDEEIIIAVGQVMLKELGYKVEIARSGTEAIDTLKRLDVDVDLVILDMIMPGMDGGQTFDRLK